MIAPAGLRIRLLFGIARTSKNDWLWPLCSACSNAMRISNGAVVSCCPNIVNCVLVPIE